MNPSNLSFLSIVVSQLATHKCIPLEKSGKKKEHEGLFKLFNKFTDILYHFIKEYQRVRNLTVGS